QGRVRLGRSRCAGRLQQGDRLDDYARRTNAALARHAATGDDSDLLQAEAWVEIGSDLCPEAQNGGYFFTAADAENLIVRTISVSDSAVPSGNGAMVFALARLFYLTGAAAYRDRAEAAVTALEAGALRIYPHGATLLNAFE